MGCRFGTPFFLSEKKNSPTCCRIKKKVYFCGLFEVECKGEWKSRV